jgi:subfamily B ATP-binding cassette protein MsbA
METGRRYIGRYALAFIFMAIAAGATALTAYMMRDLINEVFINRSREWLVFLGSAVLVIYLAKGASMYFQMVIMARIGNAIVADVQNRMFKRLLEEDVGFVQGQPSAEIAAVFANNANAARTVLNLIVTGAGRDVLSLIGLLIVMVIQDAVMSLSMIVALPVLAFLIEKMMGRVRRIAKRQVSLTAEIGNYVRETAQGFRIVKAFRMENELGGPHCPYYRRSAQDRRQDRHLPGPPGPAGGNAGRYRGCHRHLLRRLPGDRAGPVARRVLLLRHRVVAGL